jgi:hypothetical protein
MTGSRFVHILILLGVSQPLYAGDEPMPCPRIRPPVCDDGKQVVSRPHPTIKDCTVPICFACNKYAEPTCHAGQILRLSEDVQGCPKPVCRPREPEVPAKN